MRPAFWAALIASWSWFESAHAAEPAAAHAASRADDESRFRLKLVVPLWLPLLALDSSATAEGGSQTDALEVETEVSWIVMGMLETGYRPIIARVDVFGVGLGERVVQQNSGTQELTFDSSGFLGRAILMWELGPWALDRARTNRFLVAPLAGARYNRIGLKTGEPSNFSGHFDWVDPLVGLRTEFFLGDFRLGTHVDFGGFGASSEFAFWGAVTLEYLVTSWFSIWLGWQHYQVHFEETSEPETRQLNLYLTGPSAGVGLYIF